MKRTDQGDVYKPNYHLVPTYLFAELKKTRSLQHLAGELIYVLYADMAGPLFSRDAKSFDRSYFYAIQSEGICV